MHLWISFTVSDMKSSQWTLAAYIVDLYDVEINPPNRRMGTGIKLNKSYCWRSTNGSRNSNMILFFITLPLKRSVMIRYGMRFFEYLHPFWLCWLIDVWFLSGSNKFSLSSFTFSIVRVISSAYSESKTPNNECVSFCTFQCSVYYFQLFLFTLHLRKHNAMLYHIVMTQIVMRNMFSVLDSNCFCKWMRFSESISKLLFSIATLRNYWTILKFAYVMNDTSIAVETVKPQALAILECCLTSYIALARVLYYYPRSLDGW